MSELERVWTDEEITTQTHDEQCDLDEDCTCERNFWDRDHVYALNDGFEKGEVVWAHDSWQAACVVASMVPHLITSGAVGVVDEVFDDGTCRVKLRGEVQAKVGLPK